MDLSALIFVALAVAWGVYLVPKALRHHDEVQRSRSVDRFSQTMRVLARREPVGRRDARLVVTPGRSVSVPVVETKGQPPVAVTADTQRAAANRAARRRRNVLTLILLVNFAVIAVASASVIAWAYVAIPAGLLVAWLVACRLMVKRERAAFVPATRTAPEVADEDDDTSAGIPPVRADLGSDIAEEAVTASSLVSTDPSMWDMVPVTLPTYVSKPAAVRRSVQTIDLDSTGVWSSGRSEVDSALARSAEDQAKADKAAADDHRAVGS
ncbi:hypothetical protein [Nocardioides sp. LHG3406-4]|uniref:divisome protein SepX/GlpR n=1 Tax=Nocardioides sp. LHG3406-4 TaxID=2804575 RepID=UPI003CF81B53